jgi:hypothetical protein
MKRTLIVLTALIGLAAGSLAAQDLTDIELLSALDEARFFNDTITQISIRIYSETPDETREAQLMLSFLDTEDGSYARIEFASPEELAGQIFLSTPDATYFYGPDLDFPIKTSATTQVFGDSAVAQTSGIRFADSYTVQERRTVITEDGLELWEIDLVAIDFTVAFQAVTVTVDPIELRPISAILYAVSGLPFYEVFYEGYEIRDEDVYVATQRIVNQLLLGRITTSEILEIASEVLSPSLFDPASLGAAP